ncbi:MAG: hypothetical protein KJZ54_09325 [Phycisphaerales bacterium]|nr:hypothetical protein [Phycisphaerales bacterium]
MMRPMFLLAPALVLASTAHAQFIEPDGYGWSRGDDDSAWFEWDVFTSATGGNLPDVGQFPSTLPDGWTTPDVYDTSGLAIITSSGNFYSFVGPIALDVVVPNYGYGGGSTTLILQIRTQGNELDYGSVNVWGVLPEEHVELTRQSLGEFGWLVDSLFRFELEGNESVYVVSFAAADAHAAIDRIAVDTFARADACAADFNGDTVVNTLDFVAFLNAFVAQDGTADFNGDTVVNTLDFVAFLNAFVAGC